MDKAVRGVRRSAMTGSRLRRGDEDAEEVLPTRPRTGRADRASGGENLGTGTGRFAAHRPTPPSHRAPSVAEAVVHRDTSCPLRVPRMGEHAPTGRVRS